jgi:ribosomal protein S18 acetylase RimI-like enzyme
VNNALQFRKATLTDAEKLNELVNSAYRGESSQKGWTTEHDLLGGQRCDPGLLRETMMKPDSVILLAEQNGELIGSVHLENLGAAKTCYFGMFTIKPTLQGSGLGKILMNFAEDFARREWKATAMEMTVITLRTELIAFYERRGYRFTGEIRPFHADPRFGIQKRSGIELGVWRKSL